MGSGDYTPPSTNKALARIAGGLEKQYPRIVQALGKQILPAAEYEQQAQEALVPRQEQLSADIYSKYAPIYSQAAAGAELAALQGAGGESVRTADKLNREIDPEYFQSRAMNSEKLIQLLSGLDPNRLTGAENEGVARGLARYGAATGSLATPSKDSAIKNALMYGSALQQKRNTVANAINSATQALPTFRQGVDVFGQATGRAGTGALGQGYTPQNAGVQNQSQAGQGALQLSGGLEQLRQQLYSQKRHYTDFVNQSYTAAGTGTGGFASAMGCFIIREALDYNLPAWFENIIPVILANAGLKEQYLKLAEKVVPLMRVNPEFKEYVKNNFALPIIQAYE